MKVWAAQAEYMDDSDQQISWWELALTVETAKALAETNSRLYLASEYSLEWQWVETFTGNGCHWAAEADMSFDHDGSSVRYYSVFEIEVK